MTPVTLHAQTALKAAMSLHPHVRHRLEEIERVVSETRESPLRKESIDTKIGLQASNCFACHVIAHA